MNIMLGNLTVEDMERRMSISFPDELKKFMNENHQQKAENVQPGKWHCFDLPFFLVCGDMDTAIKIHESLKPFAADIKESLQIGVS